MNINNGRRKAPYFFFILVALSLFSIIESNIDDVENDMVELGWLQKKQQ
jgi:hypothetical protein